MPDIPASEVKEYTFSSGQFSFSMLNLGCAITAICVPDRNGNTANVVLPFTELYKDPSAVFSMGGSMGLTIGRYANRISGASFSLNGKKYSFETEQGRNFLLHSGKGNMGGRLWNIRKEDDGFTAFNRITEEEDGFPGTLDAWVRFSFTAGGVFSIRYKISCTEDCPVNFTNHTYFNLTGNSSKSICGHRAQFWASRIVDVDSSNIPTGKLRDVRGSAFDFSEEKEVGRDIDEAGGYDHAYVIDRPDGNSCGFIRFCRIAEPESGRILEGYTDLPAFQFYTGNNLKGRCGYADRSGLCLETEFYPDSVNRPEFPCSVIKAGELFESSTCYRFSTDADSGLSV